MKNPRNKAPTDREVAGNAASLLLAVYAWADRVKDNGGPTCLSGISTCKAMLDSLEKNRNRAFDLVINPALRAAKKELE